MDRREFVKLLSSAILVPSLAGISASQKFPIKWRYRGFDVVVDEIPRKRCKQVYASDGKYHGAILVDNDTLMSKMEQMIKVMINRTIKKRVA